jgi:putative transposase
MIGYGVDITDHPTAVWTARQIIEAFPDDSVLTAPRAPGQNPFVERVIGSIRRECLDHFLSLSEAHLRRLLHACAAYYNTTRPHQSLDDNSPQPRAIEPPPSGRIIAIPQVGGLHHRYQRAA